VRRQNESESVDESAAMNTTQSVFTGNVVMAVLLCIALGAICILSVVALCYIRRSRKSAETVSTLEMNVRTRGPGTVSRSDSKYLGIIEMLKECDPDDWESYLDAFRAQKLNDDSLRLFPCDPGDDTAAIWKELIPPIGVRMAFKRKWAEHLKLDGDSNGTTPGGLDIATPDTADMDLEEAECEGQGNQTGYGQEEDVVPPMDGDHDGAMPFAQRQSDIAPPHPSRDAVTLQKASDPAPGNMYHDQLEEEEENDDDEAMYRHSVHRQRTRGSFKE